MIGIARAALVLAGLCSFLGTCAADEPPPPAPYEMIRSLQLLEDQIARGNTIAQAAQPKLITHIAERFLTAEPGLWQTPVNARAAVIYLLSGGKPSAVRTLLDRGNIATDYLKLTKGALAYAEGRNNDAHALLDEVDARTLPSYLGGHLALVQSMLLTDKERPKTTQLLDLARLLVPGTLVEEAALRREIYVVADASDVDKFLWFSAQYALRFGNSVYAGNFRQHFASSLGALGLTRDVPQLMRIDNVTRELVPADQRKLYLAIARSSIVQGKTDVAAYAAQRALGLSTDDGRDQARSKLYLGASMIVTDKYDKGLETLEKVDRSRLSEADAQLFDAAMDLAKLLRKQVEAADAAAKPAAPDATAKPAAPDTPAKPMATPSVAANTATAPAMAKPAVAAEPVVPPAAAAHLAEPPPEIDLAEKAIADADLLLKDAKP